MSQLGPRHTNIFANNIAIKDIEIKRYFSTNIFLPCELKIFNFGQFCSTDVYDTRIDASSLKRF